MMPIEVDPRVHISLFDDFFSLNTAAGSGLWQSVNDGSTGTLALNSSLVGGYVNIPSAAADNDYQVLATQQKPFKFAAGKPLWAECTLQLTEANTSAANWLFGLCSVTTGGILADNGGGVPSSFDGALIYKVDGALSIKGATSAGSVQTKDTVLSTFVSGTSYRLGIHFDPADGVAGNVLYLVNGVVQATHRIALGSLAAMSLVFGAKAGSASAETLNVDYVRVVAMR